MTRGICENLTGKRFGHLVVRERTVNDKQNNSQWICDCDCGNTATIRGGFLRKGQIICSRQCPLNPACPIKDITGQIFGKLTAVKHVGFDNFGKATWLCKCECGADSVTTSDRLSTGITKTCGARFHDIRWHGQSMTRSYKSYHYYKYMTRKKNQLPSWVTDKQMDEMKEMYKIAHHLTKVLGEPYEVDHIIPLQGKLVSGLHVPDNLQIITRSQNRQKSSRFSFDDVC